MNRNSRFDCLMESNTNKQSNRLAPVLKPAPAPKPAPKHTQAPEPTQAPAPAPAPEPAPAISWKERIQQEKQEKEKDYPERGWVMYKRDKKTGITTRITNPMDDREEKINNIKKANEEELYETQLNYEASYRRLIENFEEDVAMGRRDDFYHVEDYIAYLDAMMDDDQEDEEYEEEYSYENDDDDEDY